MSDLQARSSEPLLKMTAVSVEFGRHCVLADIDLEVRRGESLAVIGESGCGKTVLLKHLIGLLRPTRGSVYFDGVDLRALSDRELTRQRTRFGFLFQQAALFDSMTIAQNVGFPLRQHTRKSPAEIEETVAARLAEVGLPHGVMRKKPAELSGGMRKRVGLARALAMEPEVMLYDEPTTGLDPIMSDVINELIIGTRRQHRVTSVIVTHDMITAQKCADRVVMLYPLDRLKTGQRQVVYDGPAAQIDRAKDPRVSQFVRGWAGDRLDELRGAGGGEEQTR